MIEKLIHIHCAIIFFSTNISQFLIEYRVYRIGVETILEIFIPPHILDVKIKKKKSKNTLFLLMKAKSRKICAINLIMQIYSK